MKNKNVLITGATSGIGRSAAIELAKKEANIFFIARNIDKAEKLKKDIFKITNKEAFAIIADLSSMAEIRQAAKKFKSLKIPLNVLLNNAGLINNRRKETVDGYEEIFAINHLAYFLLTNLLIEELKQEKNSRIINVSSGAHAFVKAFNFDDIHAKKSYKPFKVYGYSKLANILFTRKLSNVLKKRTLR